MSNQKQKQVAAKPVEVKVAKVYKPKQPPKVARGTQRALRRAGLVKDWRQTPGAAKMLPAVESM
jgi:hypothetical protein